MVDQHRDSDTMACIQNGKDDTVAWWRALYRLKIKDGTLQKHPNETVVNLAVRMNRELQGSTQRT